MGRARQPSDVADLSKKILKLLSDERLHSIQEIADELDQARADVEQVLIQLHQADKVGRYRRRWSI